ncbi:MAG: hypothetical protein ACXV7G_14300, partial [Halobacteriota archaeon]
MCVTLALLLALMLFCSLGTLAVAAAQTGASDKYTVSTPVGLNYVPSMFSDSKNVYTVVESTNITFSAAPSAFVSVLDNVVAPYVIIAVVTGLMVVLLYLYVRRNVRRGRHVAHLQAASRRRSSSSTSRRALLQNERTGAQQPHNPEIHVKLNDVSVQNLLAVVLSLQIALWALIGLNALGISIPIVPPLIGFIYLTFVPGILIVTALRMRDLAIVELALYAVGLSVTSVLSIGLVANIVFNASNTIKPFSLLAATSSLSFVVLVLCAVAYFRNRTDPKPLFT